MPQAPENRKSGEAYTGEEAEQNALAYRGTSLTLSQLAGAEWLASIIMSGTCEKFPGFSVCAGGVRRGLGALRYGASGRAVQGQSD